MNITWTVTAQEADVIMNALAQRPFAEVTNLIQKLLQQANPKTPVDIATGKQAGEAVNG